MSSRNFLIVMVFYFLCVYYFLTCRSNCESVDSWGKKENCAAFSCVMVTYSKTTRCWFLLQRNCTENPKHEDYHAKHEDL